MRKFSVRPTLTLKGRTFKGLRGWSGKPLHPPLTDIPIAAYLFGAVFDVLSVIGGKHHAWAREMWHAGTYVFVGGAVVSLLTALVSISFASGVMGILGLVGAGMLARYIPRYVPRRPRPA